VHGPVPSIPARNTRKLSPGPRIADFSGSAFATWRQRCQHRRQSRRPCARALAWWSFSKRPSRPVIFRRRDRGTASVPFAAGLACQASNRSWPSIPLSCKRAYDQLIHDVRLAEPPRGVRPGTVAGWSARRRHAPGQLRHFVHGCIPNMVLLAPSDENECRQMLFTGTTLAGPSAIRYPRGTCPGVPIVAEMAPLPVGRRNPSRGTQRTLRSWLFGTLLRIRPKKVASGWTRRL